MSAKQIFFPVVFFFLFGQLFWGGFFSDLFTPYFVLYFKNEGIEQEQALNRHWPATVNQHENIHELS